nr:helix-turn-helix domain-containing protein [Mucilaginibacter sp. L294]
MSEIEDINAVMAVLTDASTRLSYLLGQPVEVKITKPVVPEMHPAEQSNLHLKSEALKIEITRQVCAQYMLSMAAIKGESRKHPLPDARKLIIYLIHEYVAGITDGQIAMLLCIDRTTVIHHRKACEGLLHTDKELGFNFRQIIKKLDKYINNKN